MLDIRHPTCQQTGKSANIFCSTKNCSQPAFACNQDCLQFHNHPDSFEIGDWQATLRLFLQFSDHSTLPQDLTTFEKQQKRLYILIGLLKQVMNAYELKIKEIRNKLVLNQKIGTVLEYLNEGEMHKVTGDDMHQIQSIIATNQQYVNRTGNDKMVNDHRWLVDKFLDKISSDIKVYEDCVLSLRSQAIRQKAQKVRDENTYPAFIKAIQLYDDALKLTPQDSMSLFGRGQCKFEIDKYNLAIEDFNEAIKQHHPENNNIFAARAWAYCSLNKFNEAQADIEHVLEVNPKHLFGRCLSGYLKVKLSKMEGKSGIFKKWFAQDSKVLKDFEDLARQNPANDIVFYFRGKTYFEMYNFEAAIKEVSEAIKIKPNWRYYDFKGSCYFEMNQYNQATRQYSKAIQLDESRGMLYHNRGKTHLDNGCFNYAMVDFDKAIIYGHTQSEYLKQKAICKLFPDFNLSILTLKDTFCSQL